MTTPVTRGHNGQVSTPSTGRGRLRVFLGVGPGSGKTYAMVQEGHRLATSLDVVIVDCDGVDPSTAAHPAAGLERLEVRLEPGPRRPGAATVVARAPQVALVDGLARPGRHRLVEELLQAGIDVVTTVDITEVASVADAVAAIIDLPPPHTLPDAALDDASVHLVDATAAQTGHRPADLHGRPLPAAQVASDQATALRQVALLWLAEHLDSDRPRSDQRREDPAAYTLSDGAPPPVAPHRLGYLTSQPSGWRLGAGWVLAVLGPPLLTAALLAPPVHLDLQLIVPLFLALVVLVALLGGVWPALVTAALSSAGLNWFFTPPRRTWIIHDPQDVAAIAVFLLIALAVASVVHRNVQRTRQAVSAQREAAHYADLATSLLGSQAQLDLLLHRALVTFSSSRATVEQRSAKGTPHVLATAHSLELRPEGALQTTRQAIDAEHDLVLEGRPLGASERRLLTAYAATASAILTRLALQASHSTARSLERDNTARTALLSAVSHDLRTPLASIKAASSGLLDTTVTFSDEDRRELLETIDRSSDELDLLIRDLLDVSRLHQGSLVVHPTTFRLTEALPSTPWPQRVTVSPSLSTVTVLADRGLLERVVANVVDNALDHAGPTSTVTLSAQAVDSRARLLIQDDGPGIATSERHSVFVPFQRRGDAHSGHVGLGLAISRGLVEAMDGSITAAESPGGGLTMVVDLPAGSLRGSTPAPT
jgi:K+-sensing histidine kinase KdpD